MGTGHYVNLWPLLGDQVRYCDGEKQPGSRVGNFISPIRTAACVYPFMRTPPNLVPVSDLAVMSMHRVIIKAHKKGCCIPQRNELSDSVGPPASPKRPVYGSELRLRCEGQSTPRSEEARSGHRYYMTRAD